MNKSISVLIILLFSLISTVSHAGEDGNLKLKENNKNGKYEVTDCFEKATEEFWFQPSIR